MADLRVGKPDTTPDAPSHVQGVSQGNESGGTEQDLDHEHTGERRAGRVQAKAKARRSTGINPGSREPIHPDSPTLPPA